jgi:hypothetical protein
MFGPRLSLMIHITMYIGSALLGTGAILTPTVFFDYYKQQNGMSDEDANAFDMITGVLAGASLACFVNLYCLQRRGMIVPCRKSWRESCSSPKSTVGATAVIMPEDVGIRITVHKNPSHYYIPNVRQPSTVTPSTMGPMQPKQIRYTMPPRIGSVTYKKHMKTSYMKKQFSPIKDGNGTV